MKRPRSELLSIDEIAALLGRTIEETKKILEKSKLPIIETEGEYDLYDYKDIVNDIVKNPDFIY